MTTGSRGPSSRMYLIVTCKMTGPVWVRRMTSMPNPRSVIRSQRACSSSSR